MSAGDDGGRTWQPWPGLVLRVTRLPDREDVGLEAWQRTRSEDCEGGGDRWQYTAWLPPDVAVETWDRLGTGLPFPGAGSSPAPLAAVTPPKPS